MKGYLGIVTVLLVITASMQPPPASAAAIDRPLYPAYKKFVGVEDILPDAKNTHDVLPDAENIFDALARKICRRGLCKPGRGK